MSTVERNEPETRVWVWRCRDCGEAVGAGDAPGSSGASRGADVILGSVPCPWCRRGPMVMEQVGAERRGAQDLGD